MKFHFYLASLLLIGNAFAQKSLPRDMDRQDRQALTQQAQSFVSVASPVIDKVSDSVVSIQYRDRLLAYGTVTEKGILTKWSEIQRHAHVAQVVHRKKDGQGSVSNRLKLIGIFKDYDLALLENPYKTPAIQWEQTAAHLGEFIVMAGMDDRVAGIGVVSVEKRSLRQQDRGFLGITMDFSKAATDGVRVTTVQPGSSADKFKLKPNDYLTAVNDEKLQSAFQTRNLIQRFKPGQNVKFTIRRGSEVKHINVILGSRPKRPSYPAHRLNQMENMGAKASRVRTGFPSVIQSDMQINANSMGAPVVNLDGKLVGISISRSRQQTYIIPADDLQKLLKTEAKRP